MDENTKIIAAGALISSIWKLHFASNPNHFFDLGNVLGEGYVMLWRPCYGLTCGWISDTAISDTASLLKNSSLKLQATYCWWLSRCTSKIDGLSRNRFLDCSSKSVCIGLPIFYCWNCSCLIVHALLRLDIFLLFSGFSKESKALPKRGHFGLDRPLCFYLFLASRFSISYI